MARHLARRPRARLVRALLAVAVLAELACGLVVVAERSDRASRLAADDTTRADVAREPDPAAAQAEIQRVRDRRAAAVRELLARRAAAVLRRDRAAFAATIDPRATRFRARQDRLLANLAKVPLGSWTYRLDPDNEHDPGPTALRHHAADETWLPEVTLHYALRGFDPEPTRIGQRFTFVRRGDRWYVAEDEDFPDAPNLRTEREIWDFGPIDVVETSRALVLGATGRRSLLRQIGAQADASVPRVTRVWGADWPQRVVVLVPNTQSELGTLISEGNDLSQIAAVAIAQLGGERGSYRPVGNRIIVNPPNFAKLSDLGRRVVLQHEITHVATRDVTDRGVPTWLVEGFADYVGYLGTDVPVRTAARELRAEVRAGKLPKELPGVADFNGLNPRLAQTYEMSWLACRFVVERTSEAHLVRFYRALGSLSNGTEAEVRAVWRSVLGTTPENFVAAWREYLRRQLA